jgi:hypothetical protein
MIFHENRDNGWIQYRRNLVCHLEDGRLDGNGFMVLSLLLLLADSDSGTLKTCASALVTSYSHDETMAIVDRAHKKQEIELACQMARQKASRDRVAEIKRRRAELEE